MEGGEIKMHETSSYQGGHARSRSPPELSFPSVSPCFKRAAGRFLSGYSDETSQGAVLVSRVTYDSQSQGNRI